MTENPQPGTPASQEPSMEDILASIRRILAEDTPAEPDADRRPEAKAPVVPEAVAPPAAKPSPPPEPAPAAKAASTAEPAPAAVKAAPPPEPAPPPVVERAKLPLPPQAPAPRPEAITPEAKVAAVHPAADNRPSEEIFELTQTMKKSAEHLLVSSPTGENATDVLAQLAKAILEQRDVALGAHEVTLEGMVRAMLRPLLKEWLDRNLPYLIERLVKREIDLMVNRAERLE
jgi:hypothetical protein